ncbi:hypothetical protein [Breznakiella homolactica]|uniref:DUF5640 domain-containing protein n=1 Tax=Breznakiella homolactica TaxID=2798577 RepID=A0A7T7XJ35_9SPIR|nr:hypothetical protein [Breznakiella homolactica]QQO07364.1 hypothetical protein JFL75_10345 [Breznakiella homolactica]
MRTRISIFAAVLLFASSWLFASDWVEDIAPPSWILGKWKLDTDDYTIEFTRDDIFDDGESVVDDFYYYYIIDYAQRLTGSYYEIYIEYDNGFWWCERFFKTTGRIMQSSYEDSDEIAEIYTYTKQ